MDPRHTRLQERIFKFLEDESPLSAKDIRKKLHGYEGKSIRNRLNAMHKCGDVHIACWRRSLGVGGRPTPYYALGTNDDAPAPEPLVAYRKASSKIKEPAYVRPDRSRYVRTEFDPFVQLYRPAVDFLPDDAFEAVMRPPRF